MSKDTDKSLFMLSPLTAYAGFYQQLLSGTGNYQHLGNHLIQLGEQAHAFRQFDRVKEIGQILFNFPLKQYSSIGAYFLGVALNSCGNGDQDKAKKMFELVVDTGPDKYKVKSILSLAAVSFNTKEYDSALYFYKETIKAAPLDSSSIQATRTIALMKGMEGRHHAAVRDLESFYPLIKYAPPHVYFDYLNSYAVELGAVGRKEEARNISRIVLASPFTHAYPEWRETADELKEPSRSFVAVPTIEPKPVEIETVVEHHASVREQPARVVAFPVLKEAPQPQKPDKVLPQEYVELTANDKRELIFAALKSGAIEEAHYFKVMLILGLISFGPSDKVLDLEDDELLDDIAIMWSRNIGPEEFVGFLSALRDCDDDLRRTDILDRLITKIFHETKECGLTEEEWRLRVERRLPKK